MSRKKPLRMTADLCLSLPPELISNIKSNASALGLSASEYISVLAKGHVPVARPGAEMQEVNQATDCVIKAINLLNYDRFDCVEMLRVLMDAQRFLVAELLKAVPVYDAAVVAQGKDGAWGDVEDV